MSIVFYSAPWSSALPVACALAELKVPHEKVSFDLSAGNHKKPDFLALNPNGKVPTLVVDGAPMFEALAILQWLGERYGVEQGLWPAANTPERLQALSWSTWSYVSYVSKLMLLVYSTSDRVSAEVRNPAQAKLAREELDQLLGVLEARLAKQKYMLGARYTLVDLVVASVIGYGVAVGHPVDGHPHVKAWVEDFQRRDSFKAQATG
jgi:glutathione S-transferase